MRKKSSPEPLSQVLHIDPPHWSCDSITPHSFLVMTQVLLIWRIVWALLGSPVYRCLTLTPLGGREARDPQRSECVDLLCMCVCWYSVCSAEEMIKKDKRILSTQPLEDLSDVLLSNYLQYCCLCLAALSLNNYYGWFAHSCINS